MHPSRQSRSIASPDVRDFNETSAGPSDAPHVRAPGDAKVSRRTAADRLRMM